MLHKFLYQVRNWRAHWRALWLGTSRTDEVDTALWPTFFPHEDRSAGEGNVGVLKFEGVLSARLIRAAGGEIDLGVLSRRVVTNAGVNYLASDFSGGANDVNLFKFHDAGTGVTAEAVGDTDLVTPAGPTTRATGSQTNPTAPQYASVGTITYAGTLAITEHGLFSTSARASGTLWDRSVFSAINVVNSDSIEFTYTLTITAGG